MSKRLTTFESSEENELKDMEKCKISQYQD